MSVNITYFVHGTTTDNEKEISSGWFDVELSELGIKQSKDLKGLIAGKCVAIVAHKAPQLALDVLVKGQTWEEAFANDWRKQKAWKPGWNYEV